MRYRSEGFYTSHLLDKYGVHHGFGTRMFDIDSVTNSSGEEGFIFPETKQVHGTEIHFLEKIIRGDTYIGDAFFTSVPKLVCLVRTADCLPILIYDTRKKVVGAIHAGWCGVKSHLVTKSINALIERGSRPEDIIAVLGPRIRKNCYEFGDTHMSLACDVVGELGSCGILDSHIDMIQLCTYCDAEKFYSYRREKEEAGRQANFIYLI